MLTLLPALLLIFGRRAFWPFVPHTPATRRARAATGGLLAASSVGALAQVAGACLVVLGAAAAHDPLGARAQALGRRVPSIVSLLDGPVFTPYELRRVQHEHVRWTRPTASGSASATAWRSNPQRTFLGAIAVLGVMCLGLTFFSTDLTTNDGYRTKVESGRGSGAAGQELPAGSSAPTDIIVADAADVKRVSAAVAARAGRRGRVGRRCPATTTGARCCRPR